MDSSCQNPQHKKVDCESAAYSRELFMFRGRSDIENDDGSADANALDDSYGIIGLKASRELTSRINAILQSEPQSTSDKQLLTHPVPSCKSLRSIIYMNMRAFTLQGASWAARACNSRVRTEKSKLPPDISVERYNPITVLDSKFDRNGWLYSSSPVPCAKWLHAAIGERRQYLESIC
jgi:hypothetical protein